MIFRLICDFVDTVEAWFFSYREFMPLQYFPLMSHDMNGMAEINKQNLI